MGSLSRPLVLLAVLLAVAWLVFSKARSAARESQEKRREIMRRSSAGAVVGVVLIGLGVWAYAVMNKESPAPIIPLVLGVVVGGGLTLLSFARLLGAVVSRS